MQVLHGALLCRLGLLLLFGSTAHSLSTKTKSRHAHASMLAHIRGGADEEKRQKSVQYRKTTGYKFEKKNAKQCFSWILHKY
jgi:hypothetical protein